MDTADVAGGVVSLDHDSPTRGICLEPTGSLGLVADEGCVHIVTEAEAAEARADEVRETLSAFLAPTCGICLEPAGSMDILPDGCSDAETVASSGGLWWRMRLRLNVRGAGGGTKTRGNSRRGALSVMQCESRGAGAAGGGAGPSALTGGAVCLGGCAPGDAIPDIAGGHGAGGHAPSCIRSARV